jgi:hypothetical protein
MNLTWPRVTVGLAVPRVAKEVMGRGRNGPAPRWCPRGLSKTHCHRLQKLRQREVTEKGRRRSEIDGLTKPS